MFQYFTFSVMLVMIGCAVFLQLSTVHKFSMLALMSAVFVVLIRVVYKDLFNNHDKIHFCWWVLILELKRGAKIFIQRKSIGQSPSIENLQAKTSPRFLVSLESADDQTTTYFEHWLISDMKINCCTGFVYSNIVYKLSEDLLCPVFFISVLTAEQKTWLFISEIGILYHFLLSPKHNPSLSYSLTLTLILTLTLSLSIHAFSTFWWNKHLWCHAFKWNKHLVVFQAE